MAMQTLHTARKTPTTTETTNINTTKTSTTKIIVEEIY